MMRTLRHTKLKTGETIRIAALQAPAGRYARPIRRLLHHKGQPWLMHVDLANEGRTDALRTTFYVAVLGTRLLGNVMIVDDSRVGILGHVFTLPEHRRKGICQNLMAAALDDFAARGGRILTLGTNYDSPPYWIYRGFGFRSVEPQNGHMVAEMRRGELRNYFAPSPTHVAPARWEHWPGISLLFMIPSGDRIRSMAQRVLGPDGFEAGFLDFQCRRERQNAQLNVLLTDSDAVVGAASVQRDSRWPGPVYLLDFFVHPNFTHSQEALVHSLALPRQAKVQTYLDRPSAERVKLLRRLGFRLEAVLASQLWGTSGARDVVIYSLKT